MNDNNIHRDYSAARYDGETSDDFDFSDEFSSLAYDTMINLLEGSEKVKRLDNGIYLENIKLTISCTLQRMGEHNGNYSAEMLFILDHSLFDEPLCEYTAGTGHSADEAMVNGADQFVSVVLLSVISAFGCTGDHLVRSEFAGKTRFFRRSCTSLTYSIGKSDHEQKDMFEIIEKVLPQYLGSKRAYWVKLFAYRCGDDKEYEARINGACMPELSNMLKPYVQTWNADGTFHCEKQFVLLLDTDTTRDTTYVPPEKVISLTEQAVKLFGDAFDTEEAESAFNELKEHCSGCGSLSYEIRALVPEIYTCALLGIKQGDGIRLMIGESELRLKKTQLRNYGYIEQGVLRSLNAEQPSNDTAYNVMQLGSVMDAVKEAISNGAAYENIYLRELTLRVPRDYVLR